MTRARKKSHNFSEGEDVRLLLSEAVMGVDQEGQEHNLTAEELALIRSTVLRADYHGCDAGWYYEIKVPLAPGWTDESGDDLAVVIVLDDSDRDADGKMPMEPYVEVNVAPASRAKSARP